MAVIRVTAAGGTKGRIRDANIIDSMAAAKAPLCCNKLHLNPLFATPTSIKKEKKKMSEIKLKAAPLVGSKSF